MKYATTLTVCKSLDFSNKDKRFFPEKLVVLNMCVFECVCVCVWLSVYPIHSLSDGRASC